MKKLLSAILTAVVLSAVPAQAQYRGDIRLGDTLDFKFTTVAATGAPTTIAGTSPGVSCYPGNSTTEITAGITLSIDFDSRAGMHNVRVVATSGNGYATSTDYECAITGTSPTVDSVSVLGYVVGSFSIEKRSAVMPTTAARTLLVSAAGAADANVTQFGGSNGTFASGRPEVNTTHAAGTAWGSGAITAASIATDAIGSAEVADGAIDAGALATDTITAAKIAADAIGASEIAADAITDTEVASDVTIASITGNVGGNVTGSVGSVATGGIAAASFAAGAIDAAAIAADAITDTEVAANVTIASVTGSVGSVTGAVGSVTGNVGGNVVGSVATVTDKDGYALAADGADLTTPSALVVTDGGNSSTQAKTDRTESVNDYWKDSLILFNGTCNIAGQVAKITAYNGTTKIVTWAPAKTATPDDGCGILLLNR